MLIASLKGLKAKNTDLEKYWQDNATEIDPLEVFDITGKGGWFLGSPAEFALKTKIEQNGKPLKDWDIKINYGIKTGLNEAFIIDTATKEKLCQQDPKSAEIIKPILRGRDIKRYGYKWADLWVIGTFPALKLNIDDYPAVRQFLIDFGKGRLEQSGKTLPDGTKSRKKTGNKWFETQDQIGYYKEFQKEKVVYPNMASKFTAVYEPDGFLTNQKCFIITGQNLKLITAILNSNLNNWYFPHIGAKLGNEGMEMSKIFVETIPVPLLDTLNKQEIAKKIEVLVEEILRVKSKNSPSVEGVPSQDGGVVLKSLGQKTTSLNKLSTPQEENLVSTIYLEAQIDQLVYQLYDLTEQEIGVIEG